MKKIYIYNNWHNGDVITNRCLIKELLKYDLDIAVGSYKNRHYLVSDLPVLHVISPHKENMPHSQCLSQYCPKERIPINTWCGTFQDIDVQHYHNWANIAKSWNRHSEIHDLGVQLSYKDVPMVDFEHPCKIRIQGRGIYLENGPTRSGHCKFEFDVEKLANFYPEFRFYCTDKPKCNLSNVVDCSGRNLVEMSFISNQCEAIVGKGSGPFICTLTEPNRKKPRAVVEFTSPRFWEYRDNPIEYLNNEGELFDFLNRVKQDAWETI